MRMVPGRVVGLGGMGAAGEEVGGMEGMLGMGASWNLGVVVLMPTRARADWAAVTGWPVKSGRR